MSGAPHFVHVYATVRVKVAVNATDHESAMRAADKALFAKGFGVRLIPTAEGALDAEYAEEVTGYLVDEAGETDYLRSANYGADYEPDWGLRSQARDCQAESA
ncbi:hypothetical protein [Sphingobium sp.]|uniref:hypothetical protein n=1 Tax=Sphingobium sp. TaxID=1912891 RepID=UPI002E2478EA